MKNLILSTIRDDEIEEAIKLLNKKQILANSNCSFCDVKVNNKNFGGFVPEKKKEKTKVTIFCDKFSCKMDAFSKIRKYNGNGSPIIKEE